MHTVTPGFCLLLAIVVIAVLTVDKKNMVVPIIYAMCFLPADLSIQIATLDFRAVRIVGLFAFMRLLVSGGDEKIEYNSIDKYFIGYTLIGSVIYIIASVNTFGAIIYKSGQFVDSIVLYIVLRRTVRTMESLHNVAKTFAWCIVLLLPFVVFEFFSSKNLFYILGRDAISMRNGEIRAAATFSHAILFGSFAAALIPILWGQYAVEKKKIYLFATYCCIFYVFASSSSGPIIVLLAVICFLFFFQWKEYSSLLAKTMLATALVIHFAREMPLWQFIYVRVQIKASSTGWHRYRLVDAAVKEFWNWCWMGYGDVGPQWHTKYWPYSHSRSTDLTNQYLLEGVRGGFITMVLFIILCYKVTKALGINAISPNNQEEQWIWWGFAVMMLAHCVSFLSVAYFGQITMLFYLTVAIGAFALDRSRKTG